MLDKIATTQGKMA